MGGGEGVGVGGASLAMCTALKLPPPVSAPVPSILLADFISKASPPSRHKQDAVGIYQTIRQAELQR